ncbi:MAG: substrate-binding domain-containing protein [Candidatus Sumerlaeota bacterium]|nr:substrate-binding domain-containing protein [Candidatus Sumerlaeota bacterium]
MLHAKPDTDARSRAAACQPMALLGLIVAAAAIAFPACDSKKDRIRIGFLVKMPDELWFQNEWRFAQKAADQYGFDLIKIGIPDGEKTMNAIDNLASKGAQGFVICAPDVKLGPAIMAKALGYKMKVFAVDDQFKDADGQFMKVPYMGLSARDIGRMVGRELYQEFQYRTWWAPDTAACAITYDELDTVRERTDGATEALAACGFPKDRIFRAPEKATNLDGAFDAASILLTQHADVTHWLVFSINDEGVLGAVRAMEGRGFGPDTIIGIGIGAGTGIEELKRKKVTGFFGTVLISPLQHGYDTARMMRDWIVKGAEPPMDTRTQGVLATRENYKKVIADLGLEETQK